MTWCWPPQAQLVNLLAQLGGPCSAVTFPERSGRSFAFVTADTASHRTPGRAGRRPCRLASPATASVLGALLLVLAAATLTLKGFDHQLTTSGTGWGFAIVLIYGGVGLVVARRQPRNPIGWLLLIFIVLYVLGAGATEYAVLAYSLGHRGLPLAQTGAIPCRPPRRSIVRARGEDEDRLSGIASTRLL